MMPKAMSRVPPQRIDAVRAFNRFYTREIGALREGLLDSEFTLAQARVLYELGQSSTTATALAANLGLDEGYLSRILRRFEQRGMLSRRAASADRRERTIALTASGRAAFRRIDARSRSEVGGMLQRLPAATQARLVAAMRSVQQVLQASAEAPAVSLRTHRAGDWGFIVQQHGVLYAREYGWNERFEGLVAGIVAEIARDFDPLRERCWIAEIGGERVGSVCLVRKSASVAKLRLLLLDPAARGHGVGRRLVGECTAFARAAGYRKIVLWTQSNLGAARHLYVAEGYRLVSRQAHDEFGKKLTAENWELDLGRDGS